ncbi:MAG TPA: ATP-binding protein [Gemmatimonadaceae bacterium]|jgi:signal transduction histidine kinase|nr:ATP-binding protein [Gemmatimonadaceae bacterium]
MRDEQAGNDADRLTGQVRPNDTEAGSDVSVLLVDDDAASLHALTAALDDLGARLVCVRSGNDALRRVLADDFAVILLDVGLPGLDGFETARLMRTRERSRATPIILVTARDTDRLTTLTGHQAGAVDILYKPLDAGLVRAKVAVFLELHRLRNQSADSQRYLEANVRLRATVAELEDSRRHAEIAQRAKDQFLATMSHEIRTPINAIIGYTQMIELGVGGAVTDAQRGYLERLDASSRHLLDLVNDVLDISKIEANEMDVSREHALSGPIVASALELVLPQAAARTIKLIDARAGDEGVAFVGDPRRVRQILVNLLSNAIKFTETGGTVTVACESDNDAPPAAHPHGGGPWACISVIDTGIGVAGENQARIFDEFQQVESGHTRTKGGTGLGLAISRRLARLMGGDLTIRSSPGAGSTFTLRLPAARADESADDRAVRAAAAAEYVDVRGLCEIGEALRDEAQAVVSSYSARLRADPSTPVAGSLRPPELEDHVVTFLADIAQALIIVDESEAQAADLLRDSTDIQCTIAERHGARRQRQGWSEPSVARDFQVLREEVERVIRGRIAASSADTEQALVVVQRLIERAETISLRSWREASRRSDVR